MNLNYRISFKFTLHHTLLIYSSIPKKSFKSRGWYNYSYFFKSILYKIGNIINESGKEVILDRFAIYLQEIYLAGYKTNKIEDFKIDYYIINHPNDLKNKIEAGESTELIELLETLPFFTLRNFISFSNILANTILNELASYDFHRVSIVINYISNVEINSFNSIEDLLFNADNNSWITQDLIKKLPQNYKKFPEQIVIGMLFGQFFMYDNIETII